MLRPLEDWDSWYRVTFYLWMIYCGLAWSIDIMSSSSFYRGPSFDMVQCFEETMASFTFIWDYCHVMHICRMAFILLI